jgi:ribose transport system ATP-binding protein
MSPSTATQPVSERSEDGTVFTLRGITKSYGAINALKSVGFDVRLGEIHALVGENGAGKSTLAKCLAGAVSPDSGEIIMDGQPVDFASPNEALDAGIRVVYQELSLFPSLTVAENVVVGEVLAKPWVNWSTVYEAARAYLKSIGLRIDARLKVEQLGIGQQQMIEIARALFSGGRVIVLDEPTSALSVEERSVLFRFVRELSERGTAFVLVTHVLEEVMAHADRVTVLRDGSRVASVPVSQTTKGELIRLIVGEKSIDLQEAFEGAHLPEPSSAPVVLRSDAVHIAPQVHDFSIRLHEGEVLCLYGDLASGHLEFAEALFGLRQVTGGSLEALGSTDIFASPEAARGAGIGFIPGDRRRGLALTQPIYKNVTLAHLAQVVGAFVRKRPELRVSQRLIERLGIGAAEPEKAAGILSGGNQQKVLFARWLVSPPRILVLVEPTRGMDVGAKDEVLRITREVARQGTGVIVVSIEPETVFAVADRILVARRGRIVAEFVGAYVGKDELLEAAH